MTGKVIWERPAFRYIAEYKNAQGEWRVEDGYATADEAIKELNEFYGAHEVRVIDTEAE